MEFITLIDLSMTWRRPGAVSNNDIHLSGSFRRVSRDRYDEWRKRWCLRGGQSGCVVGFVSDSVSCRIAVDPSFDPSCSHLLDVNNQKWFRMNAVMSLHCYCRQNQSNELFIGELSTLYLVKRYVPRDVALLVLILLTRTAWPNLETSLGVPTRRSLRLTILFTYALQYYV